MQRPQEVAALGRSQKLDAEDRTGIGRHVEQAARTVRGHRDMVFLVGRGRDRVDARRRGALLVLGDERRRRDLRDHEAGIQPRLRRQECRHAGERRIDQHGDASLGERTDLADRKRDHVGPAALCRDQKRGKIRPENGMPDGTENLAPKRADDIARIFLKREAKGVIGC